MSFVHFVSRRLSDFFPPPRYLEMPSVGLDISDEVVRFVSLTRRHGYFEPGQFGSKEIPKDVIEEGYIKDKPGLTKILTALRSENNLRFVRASLPEDKAYLFKVQIPVMDEDDIRSAVQFKIEENAPVPIVNAVFDYRLIHHPKPGDTHLDVAVTVLHSKVVDSYLSVMKDAGLVPLKLRIESQAIAHAVVPYGDPKTYLIVAVRETKTVVTIKSSEVIQYSSTIPVGGESIRKSIEKNFAVNESEARNIEQGKVIKDSNEMFQTLVNAASVLRDEIQKLLTYWESHSDQDSTRTVQGIILTGSDVLIGLDKYLAASFTVPVSIANAWVNILSPEEHLPPINERDSLDFIPALGLALPYD